MSISTCTVDETIHPYDDPIFHHSSEHEQITITTADNFSSYGFNGDGSKNNPYRVFNLDIVSIDGSPCINITGDFNEYYIIESCHLSNSSAVYVGNAALILEAGNGTVIDCVIEDSYNGINIFGNDKAVMDSSFTGISNYPILCIDSDGILFEEVTTIGLKPDGNALFISKSNNITISKCLLSVDSTDSVSNPDESIMIETSTMIKIEDTLFEDIRPLRSLTAYIRMIDCSEVCLSNCSILGMVFYFETSDGLRVTDSAMNNSSLKSFGSSDVSICNTTFMSSSLWIRRGDGDVTISDNEIMGLMRIESHNSTIIRNNRIRASNDWRDESYVYSGVVIGEYTFNLLIHNNTITGFDWGVTIKGASNIIRNNTITGNQLGIFITETGNANHIYYNRLFANEMNAMDNGTQNTWDDNISMGNYWDDVVGDTYAISGSAGSIDRWPVLIEASYPMGSLIAISIVMTIGILILIGVYLRKRR